MTDVSPSGRTLRPIALFAEFSESALEYIARHCSFSNHSAEQQIVHHLDPSRDVYFVLSGSVRAVIYSASGKEVSYRDIGAGEVFGEFAAIDGKARSATVVALSDCSIASITAESFWMMLERYPKLAAALLKHLTRLVRLYSERIREFATLPVGVRVRIELLRLARASKRSGRAVVIHPVPTHAELASRIGTHREAVTREISALRREGVVRSEGKKIVVPDLDGLENIVFRALGESLIQ